MISSCTQEDDPLPKPDSVNTRSLIQDSFIEQDLVVFANWSIGFMQAYSRKTEDGTLLDFEIITGKFPTIMKDSEGNEWNAFGTAINGPRVGQQTDCLGARDQ